MSSGERPIGAATGKQSDTEALCQPPPPRLCRTPCLALGPSLQNPCVERTDTWVLWRDVQTGHSLWARLPRRHMVRGAHITAHYWGLNEPAHISEPTQVRVCVSEGAHLPPAQKPELWTATHAHLTSGCAR